MTTKKYTLVQNAFYRYYKHDPDGEPGNALYQVLNMSFYDNEVVVVYRPLYKSKVYLLGKYWDHKPLYEWEKPITGSEKSRYELIHDPKEIELCENLVELLYEDSCPASMNKMEVGVVEKDLSDLTEEEAIKVCEKGKLQFTAVNKANKDDKFENTLTDGLLIVIACAHEYSSQVYPPLNLEIYSDGRVMLRDANGEQEELNSLPIIDYLRSQGYVFRY